MSMYTMCEEHFHMIIYKLYNKPDRIKIGGELQFFYRFIPKYAEQITFNMLN